MEASMSSASGEEDYWNQDLENILQFLQCYEDSEREITVPTLEEAIISDQQRFYELLGNRIFDSFKLNETEYLEWKVGYALFGPPGIVTQNDTETSASQKEETEPSKKEKSKQKRGDSEERKPSTSTEIGYDKKQKQEIKEIISCIKKNQSEESNILFGVVFVVIYIEGQPLIPITIFRIPKKDSEKELGTEFTFIDADCRVYNNWGDYLETNNLPKCLMCYPLHGVYERNCNKKGDQVLLGFDYSPACSLGHRALDVLDKANLVTTVGLTAVGLAALAFPISAPILAVTAGTSLVAGAYGVGRSVGTLADRANHGQSINVTNSEARNSWITMAGSIGFVSSQMTGLISRMAREGAVISSATCLAADALTIGTLVVNGLGIVNGAWNIYKKYKSDDLTALDLFQFSSSILFFTNSAINLQTAKTMIRDVQKNTIVEHRESLRSNRHRKAFDKTSKFTKNGLNEMEGNARVIKAIRHIDNKDDFYAGIVRTSKQIAKSGTRATFTETGNVNVNGNFEVHPMDFSKISKLNRQVIIDASKNLNGGKINNAQFNKIVEKVLSDSKISFNSNTSVSHQNVHTAVSRTNTNTNSNIISEMSNIDFQKLSSILVDPNLYHFFKFAAELSRQMNCQTAEELVNFMGFACPYFSEVFQAIDEAFNLIKITSQIGNSNFDENEFTNEFVDHFLQFIKRLLSVAQNFSDFKERYNEFRSKTEGTSQSENNSANKETNEEKAGRPVNFTDLDIYHIASNLAIEFGYTSTEQLFQFLEFAVPYLENEYKALIYTYRCWLKLMKCTGKTEKELATDYGIEEDINGHFMNVFKNKYKNKDDAKWLLKEYKDLKTYTDSGIQEETVTVIPDKTTDIYRIASTIADKLGYRHDEILVAFIEFAVSCLDSEYSNFFTTYQSRLSLAKKDGQSEEALAKEFGIEGDVSSYFISVIEEKYERKENLLKLQREYIFFETDK